MTTVLQESTGIGETETLVTSEEGGSGVRRRALFDRSPEEGVTSDEAMGASLFVRALAYTGLYQAYKILQMEAEVAPPLQKRVKKAVMKALSDNRDQILSTLAKRYTKKVLIEREGANKGRYVFDTDIIELEINAILNAAEEDAQAQCDIEDQDRELPFDGILQRIGEVAAA